MVTSRKAAEIAQRHGLSLSDAAALSRLAEDDDECEELAALFADKDDPRESAKLVPRL